MRKIQRPERRIQPVLAWTRIIAIALSLVTTCCAVQAQDLIEISGVVTGVEKQEPLTGVAVSIKGTVTGTVTGNEGAFTLRTKQKLPFTLVFSSIGFASREIQIT